MGNSSQNWLVCFVWANNNQEYPNLAVFMASERFLCVWWAVVKAGAKKWLRTKILSFEGSGGVVV